MRIVEQALIEFFRRVTTVEQTARRVNQRNFVGKLKRGVDEVIVHGRHSGAVAVRDVLIRRVADNGVEEHFASSFTPKFFACDFADETVAVGFERVD